jgi:hypothetical protein
MADENVQPQAEFADPKQEKQAVDAAALSPHDEEELHAGQFSRPTGWKYKQHKFIFWTLPWYASPKFQLGMVAFVCFLCPGMFNALSGLGGGGKQDATLADNMVSAENT